MFYAHLKTKAKLRSLNVHNKDMDKTQYSNENIFETFFSYYIVNESILVSE
jgi:hypothetical protein